MTTTVEPSSSGERRTALRRRSTLPDFTNDDDVKWLDWVGKRFRVVAGQDGKIDINEFKNALTLKNSFFGERLFHVFDEDQSGHVDIDELLEGLYRFASGTSTEKLKILFDIYDANGSGTIDQSELHTVLRNSMEESSLNLDDEAVESLTLALFQQADEDDSGEITFQELLKQLQRHPGILENLTISAVQCLNPPQKTQRRRKPAFISYFSKSYIKNNIRAVVFYTIFTLINVALFILSAVRYRSSNGFVIVARGCGMCLNFNCAFIVVLMLRSSLTKLRSTRAGGYLPIDQGIYIHKMVGWVVTVQSLVHTGAHLGNLYLVVYKSPPSITPLAYWEYLFTLRSRIGWIGPGFAFLSGVILDVILIIMVICSLPFIRRKGYFRVFYWTHTLYVIFWIMLILHGPIFWYFFIAPGFIFVVEKIMNSRCVKRVTYGQMNVEYVRLLPSKVTHLVISRGDKLNFKPGDYVFVNIPAIASYEWHPFTISSAPELKDVMWLHVRSAGHWSLKLYNYFQDLLQSELKEVCVDKGAKHRRIRRNTVDVTLKTYTTVIGENSTGGITKMVHPFEKRKEGKVQIEVHIDGPFGTPTREIFKSQHAVLIGAGIGVTPFASILQSIMLRYQATKATCPSCSHSWLNRNKTETPTKVDFIWINRDQHSFEWFVRLMAQLELQQQSLDEDPTDPFLELQLYMTAAASRNDMKGLGLQMAMEIMHQKEQRDVITGLRTRTQAGRPNWKQVFQKIKDKNAGKVNVFFCGAPALAKVVSGHCESFGFVFAKENF